MSPDQAIVKSHPPSDVEEVGRVAAMEREDVHGGHSQSSTVDQASDAAVQLDEIQIRLLGLDLGRFLLRNIPQAEYILLTEVRVVVKAELGVHATSAREYACQTG